LAKQKGAKAKPKAKPDKEAKKAKPGRKAKAVRSAALWSLVGGVLPAADALRKPNVIVFLVDDMRWMDCGA
jgi:hypothetical protein